MSPTETQTTIGDTQLLTTPDTKVGTLFLVGQQADDTVLTDFTNHTETETTPLTTCHAEPKINDVPDITFIPTEEPLTNDTSDTLNLNPTLSQTPISTIPSQASTAQQGTGLPLSQIRNAGLVVVAQKVAGNAYDKFSMADMKDHAYAAYSKGIDTISGLTDAGKSALSNLTADSAAGSVGGSRSMWGTAFDWASENPGKLSLGVLGTVGIVGSLCWALGGEKKKTVGTKKKYFFSRSGGK